MVIELPASEGIPGALQKSGEKHLASTFLPAFSTASIQSIEPFEWKISAHVLDNGVLRVEFDEQGRIVKAVDSKGNWPLAGVPTFLLHPDFPPLFDAWEIDHNATRTTVDEVSKLSLRVIEKGPVRAVLAGEAHLGQESAIEVRYILEAGSNILKIETDIDWLEEHRLLRFYLPTTFSGRDAIYGAPYGSVTRSQVPGGLDDEAMWEVPGNRWAAVTDTPGWDGLAIMTEAKYGFACRNGELALTLLRAPSDPAREWPGNPHRHCPIYSPERGKHTLRFAVGRYRSRSEGGELSTPAQAEALYAPVITGPFGARPSPFHFTSPLGTVVPTWVLPSREGHGYILRLNETLGVSGVLELAFSKPPTTITTVDFLERPVENISIQKTAPDRLQIHYKPFQVISLLVL